MRLPGRTEKQKGLIAIFALTLIYSLLPLFPRYLTASFDLFQQIYLRMFVGCLLLLLIFHKQINFHKLFHLSFREVRGVLLRSFIYYVLGVGLYTLALLLTKVSNVVFIGSIPLTALLGFVLLKEKVTWQKVILLLISAIGIFIISVKDLTGFPEFGLGELVALCSAFFISLGLVTRKKQSSYLNDYETALLMVLFAGIQLFIVSLVRGEGLPLNGWNAGIILVLLAAGSTVASLSFLMNYGFARVEAVLAGTISSMSTFFAVLIAFFAFGEVPVLRELLGGALIIASALFMQRLESKKNQK